MLVEMVFHMDKFFSRYYSYVIFICGNVELYVATSEKNVLPTTIMVMCTSPNIFMLYLDFVYYARR